MKRALIALMLLSVPAVAEDRAEVDSFLKAQSNKSYSDYKNWRRDQDAIERYEHTDRRPIKGNCRGYYSVEGKAMLGNWLAQREARLAWERVVRSREAEQFADAELAAPPPPRSIKCWNASHLRRCKMEARACRA